MAKTIEIKLGTVRHRLILDKERRGCGMCSMNSVCSYIGTSEGTLCDSLITELFDFPEKDAPFGGHFELKQ